MPAADHQIAAIAARLPLAQRLPLQLSIGLCVPLHLTVARHHPGVDLPGVGHPGGTETSRTGLPWSLWELRRCTGPLSLLQGFLSLLSQCSGDQVRHFETFSHHLSSSSAASTAARASADVEVLLREGLEGVLGGEAGQEDMSGLVMTLHQGARQD